MKEKWAAIGIVSTTLAVGGVFAVEPVSAKDQCGTPAMQQALDKYAYEVVVSKFKFPAPIGVNASIDNCRYYTQEQFNLVTTRVTWTGPLKGVSYDTTLYFALEGDQWSYKLLGANNETREYMMNVGTWFDSLTGTGKASRNYGSPQRGPFDP